jgi:hypothetical protein
MTEVSILHDLVILFAAALPIVLAMLGSHAQLDQAMRRLGEGEDLLS